MSFTLGGKFQSLLHFLLCQASCRMDEGVDALYALLDAAEFFPPKPKEDMVNESVARSSKKLEAFRPTLNYATDDESESPQEPPKKKVHATKKQLEAAGKAFVKRKNKNDLKIQILPSVPPPSPLLASYMSMPPARALEICTLEIFYETLDWPLVKAQNKGRNLLLQRLDKSYVLYFQSFKTKTSRPSDEVKVRKDRPLVKITCVCVCVCVRACVRVHVSVRDSVCFNVYFSSSRLLAERRRP